MGVEWGGDDIPPVVAAVAALVIATVLVIYAITAAPGDRGIPEERPTTTEVQP